MNTTIHTSPQGSSQCPDSCPSRLLIECGDIHRLKSTLFQHVWNSFFVPPRDAIEGSNSQTGGDKLETDELCSWMVCSAVFAGCPTLMDAWVKGQGDPGFQTNIRSCRTREKQDAQVLSSSRFSQLNEGLDQNEGIYSGHNVSSSSNNFVPEVETSRVLTSAGKACSAVDVATCTTLCDFPITDTWIHQSVICLISPLHLACWRLDVHMINLLLHLGADPNVLALEEVSKSNFVGVNNQELIYYKGYMFYRDRGLSPLDFVALGIRSPPRNSVINEMREGIVHDLTWQCSLKSKPSSFSNEHVHPKRQNSDIVRELYTACPSLSTYNIAIRNTGNVDERGRTIEESAAKQRRIIRCVETLLKAGANVNTSASVTLSQHYPLDTILQPPLVLYYAPSASREGYSSECLRRYDLDFNACDVISACHVMISHHARLSKKFLEAYCWRPELLDCFHLKDNDRSLQLVYALVRLGLFPDLENTFTFGQDETTMDWNHTRCDNSGQSNNNDANWNAVVRRFIVDIVNIPIRPSLVYPILQWCSSHLLNKMKLLAMEVAESREWTANSNELINMIDASRLRTLSHCCAYIILQSVQFNFRAVESLPLPMDLKRSLIYLRF